MAEDTPTKLRFSERPAPIDATGAADAASAVHLGSFASTQAPASADGSRMHSPRGKGRTPPHRSSQAPATVPSAAGAAGDPSHIPNHSPQHLAVQQHPNQIGYEQQQQNMRASFSPVSGGVFAASYSGHPGSPIGGGQFPVGNGSMGAAPRNVPGALGSGLVGPMVTPRMTSGGVQQPRVQRIPANVLDDPDVYRPATPILNWEHPRRSAKPPKLPLWLCITAVCLIQTIVAAIVPKYFSDDTVFVAVWIAVSAIVTAAVVFMSLTRHLHQLTMLMESINTPIDMDRVVEKLQNGRFSRFEEPWHVQVHIIKMFCRLLRHHHGVHPVSGLSINAGKLPQDLFSACGDGYGYEEEDEESFGGSTESQGAADAPRGGECVLNVEGEFGAVVQSDEDELMASKHLSPDARAAHQRIKSTDSLGELDLVTAGSDVEHENHTASISIAVKPGSSARHLTTLREGVERSDTLRVGRRESHLKKVASRKLSRRHLHTIVNADPLGDNDKDWSEVLTAKELGDGSESKSIVFNLLSQVKVGQDLSRVVLPVHILEPRSLLEKISDLFVHPDLFVAIGNVTDSTERLIAVARWFVSGFHMRPKGARKPYNPVLGEIFGAFIGEGSNELDYVAEQVSHHPPVTALRCIHHETGIEITSSFVPKSKLVNPNTGASLAGGTFTLWVPQFTETYTFNWPSAYVSGALRPPLVLEVVGVVTIKSDKTTMVAELDFERKGWFSGDYDVLKGTIKDSKAKKSEPPLWNIGGKWHSLMTMTSPTTHETRVLFNPSEHSPCRPYAPSTTIAKPSRCVWKHVTTALRSGNAAEAQKGKEAVESEQREIRRAREARGEDYIPNFFRITGQKKKHPGDDLWAYVGPARPNGERGAVFGDSPSPPSKTGSPVMRRMSMDITPPPPHHASHRDANNNLAAAEQC